MGNAERWPPNAYERYIIMFPFPPPHTLSRTDMRKVHKWREEIFLDVMEGTVQDIQKIEVTFGYTDKNAEAIVRGVLLDHAKAINSALQGLQSAGSIRQVQVVMQGDDFFTSHDEVKVSKSGGEFIDDALGLPKGDLE